MIKKMHQIGGKVKEMNDQCREIRAVGDAGAGLVKIEVNGLYEILNCTIDPAVFSQGDAELLEDLFITAMNEAMDLAREKHAEMMQSIAGSVDLPDLGDLKDLIANMVDIDEEDELK
jgi:DNA-binding YbaB/EbfC family protein